MFYKSYSYQFGSLVILIGLPCDCTYAFLIHFCMISSPSLEKPPVLISLLEPTDCWFDFGTFDALDAGAEACLAASEAAAWLFMLLWLGPTPEAAALLLGAPDAWLLGMSGAA